MDREQALVHLRSVKSKLADARTEIARLQDLEFCWVDDYSSEFEEDQAIEVLETMESDVDDLIFQLENEDEPDDFDDWGIEDDGDDWDDDDGYEDE